MDIKIRL